MPQDEGKKRRRLKGLMVHEVSLVDQPAVPKAKFIIAKRQDPSVRPDMKATEPGGMDTPSQEALEAMRALRQHLGQIEELGMVLPPDLADMIDEFGAAARLRMKEMRKPAEGETDDAERQAEEEADLAALEEAARRAVEDSLPAS